MARVRRVKGDPTNWYLDYRVGAKRIIRKHGPNKEAAEHTLHKILVQLGEDTYKDPRQFRKVTLLDVIAEHREWAKTNRRSYRSSVEPALNNILDFLGPQFPALQVTSQTVEEYKRERLNQGASPATINRELAEWKRMWNLAVRRGQLPENRIAAVEKLKCDNRRLRWLTKEEISRLIQNAYSHIKDIIICALATGMRKGEILSLRWNQVHFEARTIQLTHTKTRKARFVPINDTLLKVLRMRSKRRSNEYVFTTKDGKPIQDIKTGFRAAIRRAGISDCRFHDLRHTWASHAVMEGADITCIAEILGHSGLAMVRRYAHLSSDHQLDVVRRLDAIFPDSFQTRRKAAEKT